MVIKLSEPDIKFMDYYRVFKVLKSKWLVSGKVQAELEYEFSKYLNFKYAIACSSWTTGAFMVLQALQLDIEDEVIVPSYSFIATANVVKHVGAKVVFCDISPNDWNIDLEDLKNRITNKTKVIIAVDQHGFPFNQKILEFASEKGITVIRDIACSIGTTEIINKNQNSPIIAVTSFHARKIITGGEGGMVFTNRDDLNERLKLLRHQGMSLTDYDRNKSNGLSIENYPLVGYNFRLTDIQASLILSQFNRLDKIIKKRQKLARMYHRHLPLDLIQLPKYAELSNLNWQSFMISIKNSTSVGFRNRVLEIMISNGVSVKKGISPAHLELAYSEYNSLHLPNTEAAVVQNILLPLHTGMSKRDVLKVCRVLNLAINEALNELP